MKKCSYCGHENEDSAGACGGCGQSLATGPATDAAPDLKDPALDPVIVATFENTEHAGILRARLEAAGIEAWIPEECSIEFPPQTVSVQVLAKDALAAGSIATEFVKSREPDSAEAPTAEAVTAGEEIAAGQIPGRRACVSCGAQIPYDAVLCPKCGWTQPQLV